jgi:hypothetical protein
MENVYGQAGAHEWMKLKDANCISPERREDFFKGKTEDQSRSNKQTEVGRKIEIVGVYVLLLFKEDV